jgi:hypothetical protein
MSHYSVIKIRGEDGMGDLRLMFPDAEADEMNFCLFSTSGVHGSYQTIEEAERLLAAGETENAHVTFLIVHPRLVCLRYGNCEPQTPEDFAYLKKLRASSLAAVAGIGA